MMDRANHTQSTLLVCALLCGVTLAVFWPVFHHDFIIYDDHQYITENPHVLSGLTWKNTGWAFTTGYASNWHPLTWLSHMLDVQLFGLKPGWHHLVNLLFHVANSLLLFLVLKRLTGALWRSALVAALFALHPLHVESVAWAAERKDVLSTFFFMLTLGAYAGYVDARVKSQVSNPEPTSQRLESCDAVPGTAPERVGTQVRADDAASGIKNQKSKIKNPSTFYYFLALTFFGLGLMSKPMLVTLPLVLLLLDYWPLGRFGQRTPGASQSPIPNHQSPIADRHAPIFAHLQTLAFLTREKLPFVALSAISSAVTFWAQKSGGSMAALDWWPLETRLANGAIAYLGYLEKLFWPARLAVLYLAPSHWPFWQVALSLLVLVAVTALVFGPGRRHAYLAMGWLWFLGTLVPVIGLVQVGNQFMADRYSYVPLVGCFIMLAWGGWDLARRIGNSNWALPVAGGLLLAAVCVNTRLQVGLWQNSETLLTHCLAVTTDNFIAHNNLAAALDAEGRFDEAKMHFLAALRVRPRDAGMLHNVGVLLAKKGDYAGAGPYLQEAVRLDPKLASVYIKLGSLTDKVGNTEQAIAYYRDGVRLNPDQADACNNLAWMLATCPNSKLRNGNEAVGWAEIACGLTGYTQTVCVGTLAAAYAEAGRFQDAAATAQKAVTLATAAGQKELAQTNRMLLGLYRQRKAYREPAQAAPGAY